VPDHLARQNAVLDVAGDICQLLRWCAASDRRSVGEMLDLISAQLRVTRIIFR